MPDSVTARTPLVTQPERTFNHYVHYQIDSPRIDSRYRCCCDPLYFLLLSIKAGVIYFSYELLTTGVALLSYKSLTTRFDSLDDKYTAYYVGVTNGIVSPGENFHERLMYNAVINGNMTRNLTTPYLLGVSVGESSILLVLTIFVSLYAQCFERDAPEFSAATAATAFSVVFLNSFFSSLMLMLFRPDALSKLLSSRAITDWLRQNDFFHYASYLNPVSNTVKLSKRALFGPPASVPYPLAMSNVSNGSLVPKVYYNNSEELLSPNSILSGFNWDVHVIGALMLSVGAVAVSLISLTSFCRKSDTSDDRKYYTCFNYLFSGNGSYINCLLNRILRHTPMLMATSAMLSVLVQLQSSKMLLLSALTVKGLLVLDAAEDYTIDSTRPVYYSWLGMLAGSTFYEMHASAFLDYDNSMVMEFKWVNTLASLTTLLLSLVITLFSQCAGFHPCVALTDKVFNCINERTKYYFPTAVIVTAAMCSTPLLVTLVLSMADITEQRPGDIPKLEVNDSVYTVADGSGSNYLRSFP
jgi:hypothetical protein